MFQRCFSGWKHHQHIIRKLFCSQNSWFVYIFICKQATWDAYLLICLEISKVYWNGLSMVGSLVMCTVDTNKFMLGKLKLRLGLLALVICKSVLVTLDVHMYWLKIILWFPHLHLPGGFRLNWEEIVKRKFLENEGVKGLIWVADWS